MPAQDKTDRPHAGRQLDVLTAAVTDAHAQLAAAAVAATQRAVAAAHAARQTKAEARQARLAAIENRNKNAADHPEQR